MIDFLWQFADSPLPEGLFDWRNAGYPVDPVHGPRLSIWTFRGEQPLCVGLSAVLAEALHWLGPARTFVVTRTEYDAQVPGGWSPEDLQIDPTNYAPPLTEHTAKVWGELNDNHLSVYFAAPNGETAEWAFEGNALELIGQLLDLSVELQVRMGISPARPPDEPLDLTDPDSAAALLRAWGELSIRSALVSAGREQYSDALLGAIRRVVESSLNGSRFACWAACHALWSVMDRPSTAYRTEVERALSSLGTAFPHVAWPSLALGILAWGTNDIEGAIDLFESAVEADPKVVVGWRLLALAYSETNGYSDAISAIEEAINARVADGPLYYLLGTTLLDGTSAADDQAVADLERARSAFHEAEKRGLRTPDLYLRLMDTCDVLDDSEGMWAAFASLLEVDSDGDLLWLTIEEADTHDDFEPGLAALRAAIERAPDAYLPRAAYVRALIVIGRGEEAQAEIPRLREIATDDYAHAETAQLALEASDADFEETYSDLIEDIESGVIADQTMIETLSAALDREPAFADGATILAEAYISRDEYDKALEVLRRTRNLLPDHLELTLSIADTLWDQDEDDEAVSTLQDVLDRHPDDVALLARLAEYFSQAGADEMAQEFVVRAKAIDPRHPELVRVRQAISTEQMQESEDETDEDAEYQELDSDESGTAGR